MLFEGALHCTEGQMGSSNAGAGGGRDAPAAHPEIRLKTAYRRSAAPQGGGHLAVAAVRGGPIAPRFGSRSRLSAGESRPPTRLRPSWQHALAGAALVLLC